MSRFGLPELVIVPEKQKVNAVLYFNHILPKYVKTTTRNHHGEAADDEKNVF